MASLFLAKWMERAEVGAGKAVNFSLVKVSGSRMVQRSERPGDLVHGEGADVGAGTHGKLAASAAKERGLVSSPSSCTVASGPSFILCSSKLNRQLYCESARSEPAERGAAAADVREDDDGAEVDDAVDADAGGDGDGECEDEDEGEEKNVDEDAYDESEGVEVDDADNGADDDDEEETKNGRAFAEDVVTVGFCVASSPRKLSGRQKRWVSSRWSLVPTCTTSKCFRCMEVGVSICSAYCGSTLVKPVASGAARAKAKPAGDDDGDDEP